MEEMNINTKTGKATITFIMSMAMETTTVFTTSVLEEEEDLIQVTTTAVVMEEVEAVAVMSLTSK